MKKIWDTVTIVACLVTCVLIGALTLALPKKSFSDEENRPLSGEPIFSVQSLMSGKYLRQVADFFRNLPFYSKKILLFIYIV